MLEWLDRYMAKFAQTDHIRREEHARRQEEASPAHEEAVALLEAFPYSGSGRARVIAAALSAISQETLLDAAYARRLFACVLGALTYLHQCRREKHAGNDLRHEVEPELNTAVCMKRPGIVHIELMFKGEIEPVRRIGPQPKKQPGGYEQPKDDVPVSRFACIGQTEVGCGTAAEQVENGRHNDSQTER